MDFVLYILLILEPFVLNISKVYETVENTNDRRPNTTVETLYRHVGGKSQLFAKVVSATEKDPVDH